MKSKTQTVVFALIVFASLVFAVSSCNKKENLPPVISLDEPTAGDTVTIPDEIHMEGDFSDDEALHEASIVLLTWAGDTAYQVYPIVHDLKTSHFHYHFDPTLTGNYTLKVTAIDHDDAQTEKIVNFTVN